MTLWVNDHSFWPPLEKMAQLLSNVKRHWILCFLTNISCSKQKLQGEIPINGPTAAHVTHSYSQPRRCGWQREGLVSVDDGGAREWKSGISLDNQGAQSCSAACNSDPSPTSAETVQPPATSSMTNSLGLQLLSIRCSLKNQFSADTLRKQACKQSSDQSLNVHSILLSH